MFSTYVDPRFSMPDHIETWPQKPIFVHIFFTVIFQFFIQFFPLFVCPIFASNLTIKQKISFARQFNFLQCFIVGCWLSLNPLYCIDISVYCNKMMLFRWPLSLSFSAALCSICLLFCLYHSPIILHISLQIINFLNLIFLRALTQNDIFLMLLSFP